MGISARSRAEREKAEYDAHMEAQKVRERAQANIREQGIPVGSAETTQMRPEDAPPHAPLRSVGQPAGERVRSGDVDTAQNAARMTDNVRIAMHCLELHAEHRERGLIDHELGPLGGFPDGNESYRRRGSELRALGLIDWLRGDDGKVLRRLTPMGAPARVCRITAAGDEALRAGVLPKRGS